MIRYKIDVIAELARRGYTTTVCKERKLIGQKTLTSIRNGGTITTETLNTLCLLLRCQPGDIFEVVATDEEKLRLF